MLTENVPRSSEPPKKDSVSEVVHSQWYDQNKILRLVCCSEKTVPCLRYIFQSSGDTEDPYLTFISQFSQLKKLGDKLAQGVYFISMQPGASSSQHFIFGIILDAKLIIINPMGDSARDDFYKIIFKIKDGLNIDSVYISDTYIQRDKEAITSCGPICVELFNYFASPTGTAALQAVVSNVTPGKQRALTYSKEEVRKYKLKNLKQGQSKTLNYTSIDISEFLPKNLKYLLASTPEKYQEQLSKIRQNHIDALALVSEDVWPPEQSLVFKMDGNTRLNIEDEPEFLALQGAKSLPKREEKKEKEAKEPEEPLDASSSHGRSPHNRSGRGHSTSGASSGEEVKINEEVFNARWDRTAELLSDAGNSWKRRLDSIARLLEGSSICAAVALENNSFLIATNTNFIPNSEAQGYVLINTVMSFFKEVANSSDEIYQNNAFKMQFKETFRKICRESMSGLQLSAYIRDELEKDDFIDRVIKASEQEDYREFRDYISQHAEHGHSPANHSSAFFVCVALMQDFDKVIKFIRENKNNVDHLPTKSFIQAIKNYQETNIIDREKLAPKILNPNTREKMHAEMRILALIDNQLKNKDSRYVNYIGISKLCCLDCHAMIYAVNQAGYNNSLEIRGAHNVNHAGNWNAPFNITRDSATELSPPRTGGLTRNTSAAAPFEMAVATKFNAVRKTAVSIDEKTGKKITGAVGVPEYADDSQSSEGEEDDYYHKYRSYLSSMKTALQLKKEVCLDDPALTKEIAMFELGLKICETQTFKTICVTEPERIALVDQNVVEANFDKLVRSVLKQGDEENRKLLIEFLKNPVYAGKKASGYFARISLDEIMLREGGVKRRRDSSGLSSSHSSIF